MPSGYREIQPEWFNPPNGDPNQTRTIVDILDAMAEMERVVLGFLDPTNSLRYDYGATDMPEQLPGVYPTVVHVPSGSGSLASLTTMGRAGLIAHPGGTRVHLYPFKIYWVIGVRDQNLDVLMAQSEFWCKAVDQAYCANGTLGGRVKEVGLTGFYWGSMDYAETTYYGWVFEGKVHVQYAMRGG